MGQTHIVFCIPNMVLGGVETVFVNTINELLQEKSLNITILTHAKIREKIYLNWLRSVPQINVLTYYPLCNWFEDITPRCHGVLKIVRKIIFSLYKKYRRVLFRIMHPLREINLFIDYKNMEFYKELKYYSAPKIAWLHSALTYYENNGSLKLLSKYDHVVVLTDEFLDELKNYYPEYAVKVSRIYNSINVNEIKHRALLADVPNGKYFCHVSRLVAGKDIKTLLDAWDIFAKKHTDIKLYIVGSGNKATEYKTYAQKLESHDRIVFMGAMDNPYGIMRGAIANILSSEYEGFGMVLVESLALGRPVISSDCSMGPKEILGYGKYGMLFNVGDVNQLALNMQKIFENPQMARKLSASATKSLYRFSVNEIGKQIISLIQNFTRV